MMMMMYTMVQMKKAIPVLLLLSMMSVWATVPTVLSLPPVVHVDTEVTTNVVISSWQRGSAKFAFSLSCIATPSNNVEVAFGEDVNTNGVLEPEETDLVVGWNRGAWFVQNGTDGERLSVVSTSEEDVKTFAWSYRLTSAPVPTRLEVATDGGGGVSRVVGGIARVVTSTGVEPDASHGTWSAQFGRNLHRWDAVGSDRNLFSVR